MATCGRELPGELQKIKEWFRDYKVRLCEEYQCWLLFYLSAAQTLHG